MPRAIMRHPLFAAAETAQREAVSCYQQTIFNAFRETNNALVGTLKKRQEAEAQARRVLALREYARLSRLRFDNGAASYIEVLYAENELFPLGSLPYNPRRSSTASL